MKGTGGPTLMSYWKARLNQTGSLSRGLVGRAYTGGNAEFRTGTKGVIQLYQFSPFDASKKCLVWAVEGQGYIVCEFLSESDIKFDTSANSAVANPYAAKLEKSNYKYTNYSNLNYNYSNNNIFRDNTNNNNSNNNYNNSNSNDSNSNKHNNNNQNSNHNNSNTSKKRSLIDIDTSIKDIDNLEKDID